MHPVLFETTLFGLLSEPLRLHTYGLMIAIGFLAAMMLAKRQAEREGEDPDRFIDLSFYLLLAGLIGARIVFILTKLPEYLKDPIEIFKFWNGGLVWYGGFIGAALCLVYFARKQRLNYFKFADTMVPFMALAHACGRFGCIAAGCCFGKPTDRPWGIVFPPGSMAAQEHQAEGLIHMGEPSLPVHPTQLYEAGAELALFALLLWLARSKRFHGQQFLIWLAIYPVMRTVIELFRGDKERGVYILSTSQYLSILVGGAAFALYLYFRRAKVQSLPASAQPAVVSHP